ncbi:MAG TPA: MraY family glycosyltransferase [Planctomycetaceae bacterium]|nr:MraY family glycosyltransferase [Planctomycetaceae bacterium]
MSLPAASFAAACVLPALVISALATAAMRRLAPRVGLIDQPAARKVHFAPTPLGGGVGIWLGVVIPLAAAQFVAALVARGSPPEWLPRELLPILEGIAYRSERMWGILGVGTVLAVMGLIDDRRNLPWLPRLGVQLAAAVVLVFAFGVEASVFVPLPWAGQALSVLWILVLVNAFNFLDNMDGLSSGIGLIASVLFAVVMLTGTSEPRWLVGGALLVLAGSIAGFLFFHNWPPARIFMGDSGSYFIGLMLSTLTILGTFYEPGEGGRHTILAPLCILAVPLYDFGSVVLIRLSQGRSPFHPDKKHFSHRLVELGLKPSHAVLTIYLATLTTGLGGLLLYRVSEWTGAAIVLSLIACVVAMVAILETAGRRKP